MFLCLNFRGTCDSGYAPRNPTHICTTTSDTDFASAFDPSAAAWSHWLMMLLEGAKSLVATSQM